MTRLFLTLAEFAVLELAKSGRINRVHGPVECKRLAELGFIKATLGGYRITLSGQERLSLGL